LRIESSKDILKIAKANIPLFFIITLMVLAVFSGSINGEFVSDDIPGIVQNPDIRSFNTALNKLNQQVIIQSVLFLTFGLNPLPFHIFSMLLHLVNVFMFFLIVYNLFNKKIAAISTLLYAVNPVIVETVSWVSATNYLLSNFYLYVCLILYLLFKKTQNRKVLVVLCLLYLFASITHPSPWVLIIPFVIAGMDFLVIERNYNFKPLMFILPLFIIGFISYFVITKDARVTERVARLNTEDSTPYINRIPYSIYNNAELLLVPYRLTIYHEGEELTKLKYRFMIVFSLALVTTTAALWFNKKTRLVGGMLILMFISILPVFSPILIAWMVAERYLYFTTGLFTTLLAMLILKMDRSLNIKNLSIILTVLLLIAYSARSVARTLEWRTRKSLWLATERLGPYSARAHNNLGDVFGNERNWERSIWHFKRAIELNPRYSEAYHNLGNTLMQLGQYDNAKVLLQASLEINPALYQSVHKLGLIEYQQGNPQKAYEYFRKCLEIEPTYAPAIEAIRVLQTLQQKNQ